MRNKFILIFAISAAGLFGFSGCEHKSDSAAVAIKTGYHCPMHPQYHSDKPGNCPICQMTLVPDAVPLSSGEMEGHNSGEGVAGQADVHVSGGRDQMIGVKLAKVEVRDLDDTVRASAKIAYDPGLYSAILEYREALSGLKKSEVNGSADFQAEGRSTVKASRLRLRQMGLSDDQIEQAGQTGFDPSNLLVGRAGGKVWAYIELYDAEARLVKPGQKAKFQSTSLPGRVFEGTVRSIDQVVNAETRTLRARAEVPNPNGELKPDMYLSAVVYVPIGRKLAIPETAVLDTGTRQLVYVAKGPGHYEPREVRLGRQAGGYYEVVSGLVDGDQVVNSANFFIDSESKIRSAAQ
jgi:Cu(I)/Ag(I) efflux system membrane fusion protein